MARIIVTEFITLDGVIEAPARDADALLLGRVTYQGFAAAWPSRTGEFADKVNRMPKYVVSSTLKSPAWNNTTVLGDVPTDVSRLRAQ